MDDYARACATGARAARTEPRAASALYDEATRDLVLRLRDGRTAALPVDRIRWLQGAEPAQLHAVTLSPSGEGLHFAELDVDLSIPNLLADLGIDPA